MDVSALQAEVARFDPEVPIEEAWTPPASWYREPAFHELERRAVFARSWQPVARRVDLDRPGSYRAGCLGGMPWIVVRGAEGRLRAFHNVCRHKGREVLTGAGIVGELACGYHGWSYALDGRLTGAPRMGGVRGFDRADMGLAPLRVESWGPWVWIHADPHAQPLVARLAHLDDRLEQSGWERLVFRAQRSWTLACNWKVVVDNYLDGGYHIPHMHPSLDAQIDMQSYRTEVHAAFSIQTAGAAPGSNGSERAHGSPKCDPAERIGEGAIYAWVYPNFMLNRYGPCLDSNHVVPLGPDRCRVDYEFYFLPDGLPSEGGEDALAFVDASIEQSGVTQVEDIAICESVQVGMGSPAFDRGRYAPRVETGEHHFHRLLAADLRGALG